ncbi:MAG: DUF6455 family protein [Jannaschia sp.]
MNRPHPMGDPRLHLMRLRSMAAETGADTGAAFEDGTLDNAAWCAAVDRCRNCAWTHGCRDWLARPVARPRPVPNTCANAGLLRELTLPG